MQDYHSNIENWEEPGHEVAGTYILYINNIIYPCPPAPQSFRVKAGNRACMGNLNDSYKKMLRKLTTSVVT